MGIAHQNVIDAAEDCNSEQRYGDCDEVGSFSCWQECSRYEPDLDTVGESDTPVARYQEMKRASRRGVVYSMLHKRTYQG